MEQRKQGRGWNGHFLGYWARLNCESMPVIPAWLVVANREANIGCQPRRHKIVILIVANGGKMRTKGEYRRRE